MTSVLQDWVMELPLREQGTLLTGVRGCDLTPKLPLSSTERRLVAFLRYTFLNPADVREVGYEVGAFFQPEPPTDWKASELGHYPVHYYAHLMHAYEVVGYRHPLSEVRGEARGIYNKLVIGLHLFPESKGMMVQRLSEDRIKKGTVVS
jgi:hypothetical protein